MLILRSVESEQISRKNQPLSACLQMSQMQWIFLSDCFTPYRKFFSGNSTKILSHLRIPKKGTARAHWKSPKLMLSKVRVSQGAPISGFPALVPRAFAGFEIQVTALPYWMTLGPYLCYSGFRDLKEYCHPIGYLGWGSKCPLSFRARVQSYLTSRFCSDSK